MYSNLHIQLHRKTITVNVRAASMNYDKELIVGSIDDAIALADTFKGARYVQRVTIMKGNKIIAVPFDVNAIDFM